MSRAEAEAGRHRSLWPAGLAALLLVSGFGARSTGHGRAAAAEKIRGASRSRSLWELVKDVYRGFGECRLSAVAAGAAFFVVLAIFPAIAALVSIYGLFADPSQISGDLRSLAGMLPNGSVDLLRDQVARFVSQGSGTLGTAFVIGLALSLWSANSGMKALIDALNVVYREREERGFLALSGVALLFTLAGIVLLLLSMAAIVVLPALFKGIGLPAVIQTWLSLLRWPVLFVIVAIGIAVLYRFGPDRHRARWRWITWGSAFATGAWLIASALFSLWAGHFASYGKTYGSLGTAVAFMIWLWLSLMVVLSGAELDCELERGRKMRDHAPPIRPGAVAAPR